MIPDTDSINKSDRSLLLFTGAITFLLCLLVPVSMLAPRILGTGPAVLGIILLGGVFLIKKAELQGKANNFFLIIALCIPALAACSAFWSLDSGFALERSGKIAAMLLGGYALFIGLKSVGANTLSKMLPIALTLSAAICLGELLSEGWLYHTWRGEDPSISQGNVSMMNRAVVFLTLMTPLGLYALSQSAWPENTKKSMAAFLILLMTAVAVFTDSQSCHMAIVVMAVFWLAFPVQRPKIWMILSALICMGILAMPWIVQFLYNSLAMYMREAHWLAEAYAADRLEIWDFVARKALEQPFYGFGIEATRHIEHFDTAKLYTPHDHVLHPHNAVLQIWIEFGLAGALALCALITTMLYKLSKIEDVDAKKLCLAVFMAICAVGCTAYGVWQSWWLGSITLIVAICGRYVSLKQKGH